MPKRKRTREVTVKDVRTILRLSCAEGLSVREIADRLRIGKSSVSTYLYRAREAELAIWPLPEAYTDDDVLKAALFGLSIPFIPSCLPTTAWLSGTDIILSQWIL